MKEHGSAVRSRRVKRWGVAIAIAVAGSAVATSGTQAASSSPSKPKYGGEIKVAIDGNIAGFCFQNALPGGPLGATRTVYESLFERTKDGKYVGYLAKSGTPSKDYKTWTIKLREGITFSNGEVLDANVVKQNIEIGRGNIPAANSFLGTGIGVNANIVSVDVVDPLTVTIGLDRPQNDFLGVMYRAGRYVMRAPAQIANPATCVTNGIGTGPFKIESFDTSGTQLVVVRNENYWRKDASGRRLPYLDKITFSVVKEASQRAAAVRKGASDVGFFVQGDATFINDLRKRKSVVKGYESTKTAWGQWLPNINKPGSPFKHRNCRLAAAHAMDWNSYNKVRLRGLAEYSGSVVGKGHPMFTTSGTPKFNLKLAKEYSAKCKIDNGGSFKVTLYADQSTQSQNNSKFIERMLAKADIEINNMFIAESRDLVARIYGPGGNAFDFAQGTPAEGGDSAYVAPFFLSKAFPANSTSSVAQTAWGKGRFNTIIALGNHSDTTIDDLIYNAQSAIDPKVARKRWIAATRYLQSNGYTIPALHSGFYLFTNNKAKLGGIGSSRLKMPGGQLAEVAETKGFEYTGVWKG
jgi:peptide/nickel transport system substrate-binding protein